MTDAIEAGARADLLPCPFCGGEAEFSEKRLKRRTYVVCTSCHTTTRTRGGHLEASNHWNERAAIASGALVPASAVAEMRERCAKVADNEATEYEALIDKGKGEHGQPGYVRDDVWTSWSARHRKSKEIASAIRQLDIAPASVDYVVVPREPTEAMIKAGREAIDFESDDYKCDMTGMYRAMLNAATRTGGEK